MDVSGNWYLETVCPDLATMLQVRRVLYSGNTAFQKVASPSDLFGRSLMLDGKTQSTERDEHIYHEALVHPAMLLHPDPRSVFIGGGGEGATLREVLAYKSVANVSMLDMDGEVVELCRATRKYVRRSVPKFWPRVNRYVRFGYCQNAGYPLGTEAVE